MASLPRAVNVLNTAFRAWRGPQTRMRCSGTLLVCSRFTGPRSTLGISTVLAASDGGRRLLVTQQSPRSCPHYILKRWAHVSPPQLRADFLADALRRLRPPFLHLPHQHLRRHGHALFHEVQVTLQCYPILFLLHQCLVHLFQHSWLQQRKE